MAISGRTTLMGLLGDPVSHSLSPAMHNAALQQLGVDAVYLPFPCHSTNLNTVLKGLAAVGVRGLNVTIPHKQAVIEHLGHVSPVAAAIGAVNTLNWDPERGIWKGHNTDIEGFLAPLRRQAESRWQSAQAVILGSGGAARAAIQGCHQLGIPKIAVVGRDPDKLQSLGSSWPQLSLHFWTELATLLPNTQLVVNSTPIGMQGHDWGASPLSTEQIQLTSPGTLFYDLIYTPNPTELLRQADRLGYPTQDGLEMLIRQGAIALAGWLHLTDGIPEEVVARMRRAAQEHLGLRVG
ncbi:MAG: shikimate dehydrogenase [Synechococcaceae cyanobacterium SM2_3_2]|nr:shikimate dehydrogenase [Synechococcaceae cyanobacterium SM2_3_2]